MMIEIKKLTKKYGERAIFSNFSTTFAEKGLVAIIGSSGSGKSTLLNLISGLDNDYEGEINVDGTNIKKLTINKACDFRIKTFGYVFQNFNLMNLDTVFNNVYFPLETISNAKPSIKKQRVKDALKLVDIENLKKRRVNKLSGGEKQRTAIARAIINDPKVILCDEPTGALDEKNGQLIFNLLKQISKNTLVLVATHDLDAIKGLADTIIKIEDGKVTILNKKRKNKTKENLIIGTGKIKKNPQVSFFFKVRYSFQKIKAKKYRSLIVNLMLSLSLTGIGLSLIISNSVSSKVEDAFNAILNGNQIVVSQKNEAENTFSNTYSTSFKNVYQIYNKYQNLLDGIGVNYLVNFENFFKDNNEFYIETKGKKIIVDNLSSRNINDFRWIGGDENRVYYPYDYEYLDDDQIILGLSYADMANLCFSLQIQRNFTSLGHFIYENGLLMSLNVSNDYWQYDDEQLLNVVAVCETSSTCLFHTNMLWNESVFEEMMRLPSDDDEAHEFPWEMYKIYYIKTKTNPSEFLNASLYDDNLYDYVFERSSYYYNPSLCKAGNVCDEKRLYIFSVDKKSILGSVVNKYKQINKNYETYYFTSDFGYASYATNLFSGFSKNVFISNDEKLIDLAIDADTQINNETNLSIDLPDKVVQGNYMLSLGNGLRFSTNISKLIYGRKATNLNEIVISKGLAELLDKESLCLGKYLEIAGEIEENYDSDGNVIKTYNRSKVLVVGVTNEQKNYLYHNSNWTISFFRDKLGVSNFLLIPKSLVFEFETKEEAQQALTDLRSIITEYKVESPIDELKGNIDSTLDYAKTILIVFSALASIISMLLIGTVVMLNIIESKNEIYLFHFLGIKRSDINSCFVVQSIVQGLISFVISAIELIFVDIVMSYAIGDALGIGFSFSLNSLPVLVIFLIAIFIPILVSNFMLLILNFGRTKKY